MIFATVGTQLPFDRLLSALDGWASANPDVPVIAQTGQTKTPFAHLQCQAHLDQDGFAAMMAQAKVIVAHAGMGTILSAAEAGKPLILMPRRAAFGEHRNDHQLATAAEMAVLSNVTVIEDAADLAPALQAALAGSETVQPRLPAIASAPLLDALKAFIWNEDSRPARAARPIGSRVRA
jgi:UDP-N-acetylglucosamine transferase subunit ALG13